MSRVLANLLNYYSLVFIRVRSLDLDLASDDDGRSRSIEEEIDSRAAEHQARDAAFRVNSDRSYLCKILNE